MVHTQPVCPVKAMVSVWSVAVLASAETPAVTAITAAMNANTVKVMGSAYRAAGLATGTCRRRRRKETCVE